MGLPKGATLINEEENVEEKDKINLPKGATLVQEKSEEDESPDDEKSLDTRSSGRKLAETLVPPLSFGREASRVSDMLRGRKTPKEVGEVSVAEAKSNIRTAGGVAATGAITGGFIAAPVPTAIGLTAGALGRVPRVRKQISVAQDVLKDIEPLVFPLGVEQAQNFLTDAANLLPQEQFQEMTAVLGEIGIGLGAEGSMRHLAKKFGNDLWKEIRFVDPVTGKTFIPTRGTIRKGIQRLKRLHKGKLNQSTVKNKLIKRAEQRGVVLTDEIDDGFRPVMRQRQGMLEDQISKATQALDDKIAGKTVFLKDEMPKFAKNNSQSYGSILDDVSETLAKSETPLTQDIVAGFTDGTIDDLAGMGIEESRQIAFIKELKKQFVDIADDGTLVNPDKIVDFKKFNTARRSINKTTSQAKLGGKQKFTTDDLGISVFNNKWGDYVSTQVKSFGELQQAYKPIMQSNKLIWKSIQPGQLNTTNADSLLRRASKGVGVKGGISQGEAKALKLIEEGTEKFGKGVGGNTVDELVAQQQKIKALESAANKLPVLQETVKQQAKEEVLARVVTPRLERIASRSLDIERLLSSGSFMKGVLANLIRGSLILGAGQAVGKVLGVRNKNSQ